MSDQPQDLGSSRRRKRAKTSGRVEHNTPASLLDAIAAGLGPITCDPCWNERSLVQAAVTYTEADNGLSRIWPAGLVYINPPFGSKSLTEWGDMIRIQRQLPGREIALLTPNETETAWHEALYRSCTQCYALRGRLKFSGAKSGAFVGNHLFYFGEREAELTRALEAVAYPMKGAA